MREADAVLFVVDATVGVTEEDAAIADLLRRLDGPVFLVVNKVDDQGREALIWEFMSLGLGEPWPVSALHGRGTGDLLDAVCDRLDEVRPMPLADGEEADAGRGGRRRRDTGIFSVALVGRPNVGKSTLFNRLIGEERSVVHDIAGTTRDTIDTVVETDVGPIRFVDTAGMRRKARIDEGTEYYSLVRALQAVDEADVALLVIDATVGVTHQDQRLAERVDVAGCPVVVLLNKWELLDAEQRAEVQGPGRGQAALPRRRARAQDQRPHGQGRAQAAARCSGAPSPTTAPGCPPRRSTGCCGRPRPATRRPTGPGCSTPPRARPSRRRSPCSPTRSCRAPTCATSSARCARPSTWAPRPLKLRVRRR